jgi:hypothetical protein
MIMTQEKHLIKAHEQFETLCDWIRNAGEERLRIDQVERGLFARLLMLGLTLLKAFVAGFGRGDVGRAIEQAGRTLSRSAEPHRRRYVSIFGELSIERFVYAKREKQKIEHVPLDARLGLPAGDFSYVLEDWQQRLCLQGSFDEGVESLDDWLGVKPSVRSAEAMNRQMARHAMDFRVSQKPPLPDEEGLLIVVTADGKGVPMRRPLEDRTRSNRRRGKGEKKNKKQMAYVGAVYTIDRFVRTADDVIDEIRRKDRAEERPSPCHKRVWAELTLPGQEELANGKPRLFSQLAAEAQSRDGQQNKPLVCLMDGERALWEVQRTWLPEKTIGILDLFHVMERLWIAAYCFHAEGSRQAEAFVTDRLRMLLEGKVGYLLGGLRRMATRLRGEKRKKLQTVIGYLDNNRQHMKYDEYLAAGYPIGSGVAEGACRHVVKDRLERTGMRWTVDGAQAMLHLRTIYLNGDWQKFLQHRIEAEQTALYSQAV